jgi:alpha-tubulin suppressor-like RCC1 family protein
MYPMRSCARSRSAIARRAFVAVVFLGFSHLVGVSSALAAETQGDGVGWGDSSAGQATLPANLGKIIALSAGRSHSLAIRPDGSVVAWGGGITVPSGTPRAQAVAAGGFHSLVLGTNNLVFGWSTDEQLRVPGNLGVASAIAAGDLHGLALRPNGTVVGWGYNDRQQIAVPSGLASVVAIAAGEGHSLALRADGTVVGWGDNTFGQAPRNPALQGRMKAIAAGGSHSLALREDGRVFAWGDNSFGQIAVPADLGAVIAIGAGANFSVALRSDRTVRVWGDNTFGQGNPPSGMTNVYRIAIGSTHALAMVVDLPTIVTQPEDRRALIGTSTTFTVVAAGGQPLTYQWRLNGNNLSIAGSTTPTLTVSNLRLQDTGAYSVLVSNGAGSVVSRNASLVVEVPPVIQIPPQGGTFPAGGTVTLTVEASGEGLVYRWRKDGTVVPGANFEQYTLAPLKLSDTASYDVVITNIYGAVTSAVARVEVKPVPTFIRTPVGFTAFPGTFGVLSVEAADTVGYQWLKNGSPIGGATAPTLTFSPVTAAQAGGYSVRITNPWGTNTSPVVQVVVSTPASFSEVVGWGEASLWNGSSFVSVEPPVGLSSIRQVAAGRLHSLALTTAGTVYGWGDNQHGEILIPAGLGVVNTIAAGDGFSVAIRQDSTVVAWGRSDEQQTAVSSAATNVVAVSAGTSHTLALLQDRNLIAWGSQHAGESVIPAGVGKAVAIAAGHDFNLVLLENGTVTGWGRNEFGQRRPPASLSNVVSIAAGRAHGLALRMDGSVVGWGDNGHGQSTVPTLPLPAIAIAAGSDHCVALLANNQVVAWGSTSVGQSEVPSSLNSVRGISAGWDRSLAIRTQGTRVKSIQIVAGRLRLVLASADGSAIDAGRVSRLRVYRTTDLLLPLDQWTLLPPPAVSETGEVRLLDAVSTDAGPLFYRVIENP